MAQQASDIAGKALAQPRESASPTSEPASCTDDEVLAIWERMASVYGHKWTSQYGEKIDRTWKRALKSMPVDRLKVALARCAHRQDAWPPSLPEFMALAKVTPEEVGAPNVDAAFTEACRGAYPYNTWHKWSHRCVYWAATWTGLSDLNEKPNARRKAFEKEYQAALDRADELDEPPAGKLPPKLGEPGPEADEAREREMAKIREALS